MAALSCPLVQRPAYSLIDSGTPGPPARARGETTRPSWHLYASSEAEEDSVIADHLRLQPGQQALTPEQEEEVQRFVEARIAVQLSTEPIDESEAEALLRQAYMVAGLL